MSSLSLSLSRALPLPRTPRAAAFGQDSVQTGFPPATPLLVLAGYTLVFAFLARRFFRWE